ncbi:SCO family protein [Parasphingorhabdus halotolerans]|uniref:SCO family protein n=1 Tax=Parasphingorhabdus halotolerans TaxID=2725558 RepID=A0A6H2DSR9_9SPHN|nr:SCO family protein [Parasphingorhabdus halotolerans]
MNKLKTACFGLLAVFLVAGLSGCNPSDSADIAAQSAEPPLAGAKIGGSFILTNQDGGKTADSDFDGQYRLMYFGYTFCPDVCPVDLQRLMQGLRLAETADPALEQKIQPIFVTIDPERDQPEQIKQYVAAFHPRLMGLTGTAEEIADVAKKYLILYEKRQEDGASEYLMDHSRQAYLFGPEGEPIALLPYDGTPQEIADEIKRWAQ